MKILEILWFVLVYLGLALNVGLFDEVSWLIHKAKRKREVQRLLKQLQYRGHLSLRRRRMMKLITR